MWTDQADLGTVQPKVGQKHKGKREENTKIDNNHVELVKQGLPNCRGAYVEGEVEGLVVTFTVDTGASRTVISIKTYYQIPLGIRPPLQKSRCLSGANGKPLMELGKGTFNLVLGSVTMKRELVVAEIEDDALLGMDILQDKALGGPADILLSKGIIHLGATTVPSIQVRKLNLIRRVTAADDFIIPERCLHRKNIRRCRSYSC